MDREYKECLYALILGKKEQLLLEIIKIGRRRAFLLNLKKKYAGNGYYNVSAVLR